MTNVAAHGPVSSVDSDASLIGEAVDDAALEAFRRRQLGLGGRVEIVVGGTDRALADAVAERATGLVSGIEAGLVDVRAREDSEVRGPGEGVFLRFRRATDAELFGSDGRPVAGAVVAVKGVEGVEGLTLPERRSVRELWDVIPDVRRFVESYGLVANLRVEVRVPRGREPDLGELRTEWSRRIEAAWTSLDAGWARRALDRVVSIEMNTVDEYVYDNEDEEEEERKDESTFYVRFRVSPRLVRHWDEATNDGPVKRPDLGGWLEWGRRREPGPVPAPARAGSDHALGRSGSASPDPGTVARSPRGARPRVVDVDPPGENREGIPERPGTSLGAALAAEPALAGFPPHVRRAAFGLYQEHGRPDPTIGGDRPDTAAAIARVAGDVLLRGPEQAAERLGGTWRGMPGAGTGLEAEFTYPAVLGPGTYTEGHLGDVLAKHTSGSRVVLETKVFYLAPSGDGRDEERLYRSRDDVPAPVRGQEWEMRLVIPEVVDGVFAALPAELGRRRGPSLGYQVMADVERALADLEAEIGARPSVPLPEVLLRDDGWTITRLGRDVLIGQRPIGDGPGSHVHHSVGVPLSGVPEFLAHVHEHTWRDESWNYRTRRHLADALDVAGGLTRSLLGSRVDRAASELTGHLALLYVVVAATYESVVDTDRLWKAHAAVLPRHLPATLLAQLDDDVRDVLAAPATVRLVRGVFEGRLTASVGRTPEHDGPLSVPADLRDPPALPLGDILATGLRADADVPFGYADELTVLPAVDANGGGTLPLVVLEVRSYGARHVEAPAMREHHERLRRVAWDVYVRAQAESRAGIEQHASDVVQRAVAVSLTGRHAIAHVRLSGAPDTIAYVGRRLVEEVRQALARLDPAVGRALSFRFRLDPAGHGAQYRVETEYRTIGRGAPPEPWGADTALRDRVLTEVDRVLPITGLVELGLVWAELWNRWPDLVGGPDPADADAISRAIVARMGGVVGGLPAVPARPAAAETPDPLLMLEVNRELHRLEHPPATEAEVSEELHRMTGRPPTDTRALGNRIAWQIRGWSGFRPGASGRGSPRES